MTKALACEQSLEHVRLFLYFKYQPKESAKFIVNGNNVFRIAHVVSAVRFAPYLTGLSSITLI